jgi:hypothetical protein
MNTEYLTTPSGSTTVLSDLSISGTLDVSDIDTATGTFTSTLSVDGKTTLNSGVSGTAAEFSSTLSVDGKTKLGSGISGTAAEFSSTLSVDGATKAAHISCAGIDAASTVTLNDTAAPLSVLTNANGNDMTIGQLRLVFAASGLSLVYSSTDSIYIVNSAVSAAQPTS